MEFRTIVDIQKPDFEIEPCEEMLFVGSCFADSIGQCFREEGFPVTVNPYGTMYNPASILHTIERFFADERSPLPSTVFLTLGTNHVYRLKETGEIVDNCQKRPQSLFQEEELTTEQCADYLLQAVKLLRLHNSSVRIVLTVSPIRYRKYGYHESQLSKATLLLAIKQLINQFSNSQFSISNSQFSIFNSQFSIFNSQFSIFNSQFSISYFPSYEIVLDELRDYRFYAPDMLHPSQQAVGYIWERLVETMFSPSAKAFLEEWRPLKQALAHKPFNPEAPEYKALMDKTMLKVAELRKKYPTFAL